MRRLGQWLAAAVAVVACLWLVAAGFRTWRAAADQQAGKAFAVRDGSLARVLARRAAAYRPGQAGTWRLRAQLSSFADPRQAAVYARRAVALDPGDWRNWRTLGLIQFQLGQLQAARQAFAHGVQVDHGFASHFQLGNLALLTGQTADFWRQMRAALELAPPDRVNAVLQQALSVDPSGLKLPAIFPRDRPAVAAQAIIFLVVHHHLPAAAAAWRDLRCPAYDRQPCRAAALLLANAYMQGAYAGGSQAGVHSAVAIWNRAVEQGILRQDPARPGECGDGEFQHRWAGAAFSWTSDHTVYTEVIPGAAPAGNAVRIAFDGYENQYSDLFLQYVAVRPGATYAVSYASRREQPGQQTGLELRVWAAGSRWLMDLPAKLALRWRSNRGVVHVPPDSAILALSFTYARPAGQIRMNAPVLIGDVRLQELQP